MTRPQFSLKTMLWVIVGVACLAGFAVHFRPGIRVLIKNTGSTPLRSAFLFVTGNSRPLGDLAPGTTKEAILQPTGESHLEIEFVDELGRKRRIVAGGYFEAGYCARLSVAIKDGELETMTEESLW